MWNVRLTRFSWLFSGLSRVLVLEDNEPENYSGAENEQGSDEKGSHPSEERTASGDERDEESIPNPGLLRLCSEAMLRLV